MASALISFVLSGPPLNKTSHIVSIHACSYVRATCPTAYNLQARNEETNEGRGENLEIAT